MSRVPALGGSAQVEGARGRGTNSLRAMEHAIEPAHDLDLIRPWRRATIAVSAIAAIELVILAGVAVALLGNPLAGHLRESAAAAAPPKRTAPPAATAKRPMLDRGSISVMVLNGNGQAGAAHIAAAKVGGHGYLVGNVGNAQETSPRTLVMYRPGYAAEGARLGRDLHVRLVRPLDGLRPSQLLGSHLVLILGR
jgi:LytR cell envelope-related transcriptional attenuator